MEDITYCPNCGGKLNDPKYLTKFGQASTLDWTGKILCPVCNYFGFFLKVPGKEYSKIKFEPKKFPKHPVRGSSFDPGPESWLVVLIAVCMMLAVVSVILSYLFL